LQNIVRKFPQVNGKVAGLFKSITGHCGLQVPCKTVRAPRTLLAAVYTAPAYLPVVPWIFLGGWWEAAAENDRTAVSALGNNLRERFILQTEIKIRRAACR
jgi:hypothetical protein